MSTKYFLSLSFLLLLSIPVSANELRSNSKESWLEIIPKDYAGMRPKCANGDEYSFFYRKGTTRSNKLMIFFNGGGACWGFDSCSSLNKSKYPINTFEETVNLKYNKPNYWKGLLDLENINNPVKNWDILMLPYCTGDLHIGSKTNTYKKGLDSVTIHHRGLDNVHSAISWMKQNRHDSYHTLLVAGSSSGGYGAMFNYELIKKNIRAKKNIVAFDAADGVVTDSFEKSIFLDQKNPWGFSNKYDIGSNNFITKYNNFIIRKNKDSEFISYTTNWDVMQILFFNIMKNNPNSWLKFDDATRHSWKQRAENNRSILLKNKNFHLYVDVGCNHSGFRYDDSFYGMSISNNLILYKWIESAVQKKILNSIGLKNINSDMQPSESSFGACINRAVQSVQR